MSRLSGRDPLSIAPGGIGTGAAQVFDFQPFDPTEKIADAAIANAQRKQKAQAKVQEEYQNKINLFRKELDGWQDRDGEVLNKLTEDIINEGARIAAKGIDPTTLPDYRKQMEKAVLLGKKSKQDKEFYDNAFKVAMEKSKSPIYSQEDIDFDLTNLETFAKSGLGREQFQIPLKAKEEPYDYTKDFLSFTSQLRGGQDKIKYTDEDGNVIETYGVKPEKIKAAIDGMSSSKWYKAMYENIKGENPSLSDEEIDSQIQNSVRPYLPSYYGNTPPKEDTKITFGSGKFGNKLFNASLKNVSPSWLVNTFSNIEFQPEFIQKVNQGAGSFKAIDFAYKGAIPESQYKPITIMVIDKKGVKPKTETVKMLPKTVVDAGGGTYYVVAESIRRQPKLSEVKIDPTTKEEYRDIVGYEEKKTDIMTQLTPESKVEFERQFMDGLSLEEFMGGTSTPQSTTTKPIPETQRNKTPNKAPRPR